MIAEDAFNYMPLGYSLDGASGGSGSPGWTIPWSADATATVSAGLTYPGYGLAHGNAVTLGDVNTLAGISRGIGNSSTATTVWMRMLYNPGSLEESGNTATPFQLTGANSFSVLNVQRSVGDQSYTLNMTGDGTLNGGILTDTAIFPLDGSGARMLLFELVINQATGQDETLSMWLNPTSLTEGGLGPVTATISANILESVEGFNDYLALFSAEGYGDQINNLVIGTTFADAIGQLNDPVTSVPEVSGTVMMAMVGFLGGGVVWYRRRQKAVA